MVREAGRQADRALLHALADEPLRVLQAVAGHRHVLEAARLQPQCSVGDQVRGVDGGRPAVAFAEGRHAAGVQPLRRVAQDAAEVASVDAGSCRRRGGSTTARPGPDLGSDALQDALGVLRVGEQHGVRVDVRVDEARHTVSPSASMARPASACDRSPMASILSPVIPTSARRPGSPVPSTTVPPMILMSNMYVSSVCVGLELVRVDYGRTTTTAQSQVGSRHQSERYP